MEGVGCIWASSMEAKTKTYTVFDSVGKAHRRPYTQTHLKWWEQSRTNGGRNKYDENIFGVDTTHTQKWFEIR